MNALNGLNGLVKPLSLCTTVCSWAVTSLIDFFKRKGAAVYGEALDMSIGQVQNQMYCVLQEI